MTSWQSVWPEACLKKSLRIPVHRKSCCHRNTVLIWARPAVGVTPPHPRLWLIILYNVLNIVKLQNWNFGAGAYELSCSLLQQGILVNASLVRELLHSADALNQILSGAFRVKCLAQIFHLVGSGIQTNNLSVTGPTLLTARLPATRCCDGKGPFGPLVVCTFSSNAFYFYLLGV